MVQAACAGALVIQPCLTAHHSVPHNTPHSRFRGTRYEGKIVDAMAYVSAADHGAVVCASLRVGAGTRATHVRRLTQPVCAGVGVRACSAWHEAMRVWEAEAVTKKVSVAKEVLLCVKGDILAKAGMLQAAVAAYVRHLPRMARWCAAANTR